MTNEDTEIDKAITRDLRQQMLWELYRKLAVAHDGDAAFALKESLFCLKHFEQNIEQALDQLEEGE